MSVQWLYYVTAPSRVTDSSGSKAGGDTRLLVTSSLVVTSLFCCWRLRWWYDIRWWRYTSASPRVTSSGVSGPAMESAERHWPKAKLLTLWRLQLPYGMGTAIKHPVPDRVKPSFVIFDIRALSFERQSARMSKFTNDGLSRSGTQNALWLYPYGNSGCQRVNPSADHENGWLLVFRGPFKGSGARNVFPIFVSKSTSLYFVGNTFALLRWSYVRNIVATSHLH